MKEIPKTPIYCTKNGAKLLRAHYHEDWNFVEVKTGDALEIGKNKLTFIEARMLHWPDSMFTYLSGKNMLFSNDALGSIMHQNLCTMIKLIVENYYKRQ